MQPTEHLKAREWRRRDLEAQADVESGLLERLSAETGLAPLTIRVCLSRGLRDAQAIQDFLHPRIEALKDPFLIADMRLAVERLEKSRAEGEQLRIFGDYDVDGTTGAALLSRFFKDCGLKFDVRQPDRFKDGYGLGVTAVDEAHSAGVRLLVTVDCGITSHAAALRAKELGIDLLIVDHHQIDPTKGLPSAVAIVNPQRADCPSGLKELCGCGLAFYLCRALRTHGRDRGWWSEGQEPNLKRHLDLVVLATAADMVPLIGDNHILVRHGMEVLKNTRKPGMRALLDVAGIGSREVSPGHLGFVLGPRINASGRMGSASHALELLTTEDPSIALKLAQDLERINHERAETQNKIWDEVKARVEAALARGEFKHGIVVADPGWHEGVVGIVASRVTETFRRPAAVIALREDFGKGSVRTFAGKDVLSALRASSEHLLGFGGHRHAAGLSLPLDGVEKFAQAFDRALAELKDQEDQRPLWTEGAARLDEFNVQTLSEIERLGPFGPGNPEPVFSISAQVDFHRVIKERHLKLQLRQSGASIEAIWFHAADRLDEVLEERGAVEWAGVPELSRFNGRVSAQFRLRDAKFSAPRSSGSS